MNVCPTIKPIKASMISVAVCSFPSISVEQTRPSICRVILVHSLKWVIALVVLVVGVSDWCLFGLHVPGKELALRSILDP